MIHPRLTPRVLYGIRAAYWPGVWFYDRQTEIIESVLTARETYVPAANKMGKDFIGGYIGLAVFLACQSMGVTCRVVTTSVAQEHLKVLWGETGRFLSTAARPIAGKGGLISVNFQEVRRAEEAAVKNPINYLVGRVSKKGEGLAGHHAECTLLIGDESSGLDDVVYEMAQGWAKSMLFIGNPNACQNFFRRNVKAGDLYDDDGRPLRRVIRIRAEDSPNVIGRRDDAQEGVLTWSEYLYRRKTWDGPRQCVGLDAEFYEGPSVLMFPPEWRARAERVADALRGKRRRAIAIGIDTAEGGDRTAMAAVDEFGLIELVSKRTPDTSVVTGEAIAFMRKHNVPPDRVAFDRGGGGKEHADRLRAQGYPVRTVAFGETPSLEVRGGAAPLRDRREVREDKYAYKNRRAEMYHALRLLLDPANERGFGLPAEYADLMQELAPIPLTYDAEGRVYLLPKNKKRPDSTEPTLTELIGHSPDHADALCLAVHAMQTRGTVVRVGVSL